MDAVSTAQAPSTPRNPAARSETDPDPVEAEAVPADIHGGEPLLEEELLIEEVSIDGMCGVY